MNTYIGIKDVRWSSLQKHELLLFDKIGAPFLEETLHHLNDAAECADLEWLLDEGVVFSVDADAARERVNDPEERLRFILSGLLTQTFVVLDRFPHGYRLDPVEMRRLSHFRFHLVEGALRLVSLGLEPMLQAQVAPILDFDREWVDIETELAQVLRFLRALPAEIKNLEVSPGANARHDGIQVIRRTESLLEDGAAALLANQQSPVLRLVLKAMPIIDESTPLEAVLDFRRDDGTRHSFLELRGWIREISEGNLNPIEIVEKMEYLSSSYREHMRLHQLKCRTGLIETAITIGPEALKRLLGLPWSPIAKSLFSLHGKRVALLEAEASAPGRELAYLVKAKERFGRRTRS